MNTYTLVRTLHVLAALWLVIGILGRQAVRTVARRQNDISDFARLTQMAGRFESRMVIPGNMLVVLLGVLLAILGGWPIFGFLQGAATNWLLVSNLILISAMLLVPLVFLPHGKLFDQALEKAQAQCRITSELSVLLSNRAIRWAHLWENVGLTLVILLMIFKPF